MWTLARHRPHHTETFDSMCPPSPRMGKGIKRTLQLTLLVWGIAVLGPSLLLVADEPATAVQVETKKPEAEQLQDESDASPEDENPSEGQDSSEDEASKPEEQTIPIPDHWKRLAKPGGSEVWLDTKQKSVILAGHICLTRGGLEMFVCTPNTKEHESVISAHANASEVHAALLAIGATPGKPVQWDPVPKSASGSIIEVRVTWRDPDSNQLVTRWGKEMVRDYRDGTGLPHDWVFGGSVLETDPESGESWYYAESGPLLCVSNFSSACIDINVPSSDVDGNLLYEAFTENLPPKGTKVYLRLTPGKFFEGR